MSHDTLLGGRVAIDQGEGGYRVAIDPVLLAAAVPAGAGQRVLDAGAGVGAAALCLARRVELCRIAALEREPALAAIARRNATENGFADRLEVMTGDILAPPRELAPGSFDHVMANPPHLRGGGAPSPDPGRRAANVEGAAGLGAWIDFALAMLRPGATLTLIHRADRLDEILAALAGGAGGIVVFPLWPKAGRPAKRVIVSGRKGVAAPSRLAAGLVLHGADGSFGEAAEAVLRGGAGLDI